MISGQLTACNTGFASGGLTCKHGTLCYETRPNAKPANVTGHCTAKYKLEVFTYSKYGTKQKNSGRRERNIGYT